MLKLGELQTLKIVKEVDFGVYLAEDENTPKEERVLLPAKQVPPQAKMGDAIEIFLYKDSSDRPIATTKEPLLKMGEVKVLSVIQTNPMGAFLDWGLEKDLFLPFREQTCKVEEGDKCLVTLYIDKSSRLCATMKVYKYLQTDSPYEKDEKVTGTVYEISDNFGTFVAVDNCYSALIPKKEMVRNIKVGESVTARIAKVREDGKLELSIREKAHIQMGIDAAKVLERMDNLGGELPFTDKASPELIREEMNMSKNEFKRAVGNLLKAGEIEIKETKIVRKRK